VIAIVDYGMGNLRSVERALHQLGATAQITRDHDDIRAAERIVLPGVGAFGVAMERLHEFGLVDLLGELVLAERRPLLGICLGMQLICRESYEHGHHEGLHWIPATVRRLEAGEANLRVPHVGWNDVTARPGAAIGADGVFYFVHSYFADCDDDAHVAATCRYGPRFPAVLERDNIVATQFHPEKSQTDGLGLLRRFIAWQPSLAVAG
jgi:imidazole glycerol-phosphate synthase subunit HisH